MDRAYLPFVLIAIALWLAAVAYIGYQSQVAHWPTVQAVVEEAEVVSSEGNLLSGVIRVTYNQRKVTLRSGFSTSSAGAVESWLSQFPKGETRTFVVNPRDPTDLRVPPLQTWDQWMLPGVLFLLGLLLIVIPIGVMSLTRFPMKSVFGWIFVPVGLLFLLIGAQQLMSWKSVMDHWTPAEATVVESRMVRRGRYRALGMKVRVHEREAYVEGTGSIEDYPPGTRIVVRVSPDHPEVVEWQSSAKVLGFGMLAGGLVFLGLYGLVRRFM